MMLLFIDFNQRHKDIQLIISENASAGTYLFANAPIFLRALAHGLENEAEQTHNGLFFVCPLFNGVHDQGRTVRLTPVWDVTDIKVANG